jgi:hypothetical protein
LICPDAGELKEISGRKVGAGGTAELTAKERNAYDKGLVAVLASFHANLDAAVLDAYGWNDNPGDEQLHGRWMA